MGLARGRARLVGRRPFGFGRQVFQNFSVGAGEGTTAQLIQRTPAAGLNCAGQSIGKIGAKDFQRYPIARDGMADPKQRFEGARAGAEEPFSELTNVAMIEGDFDIRKLPQVRVDDTGWASANGEATATFSNERDKAAFSQGSLSVEVGQFGHAVLAERDAMFSHGAERTFRLARGANRGAQFHQSLVEMRTGRFDGSTGSRPTRFMGSLLSLLRTRWDQEPPPHPASGHPLPIGWGEGGVRGRFLGRGQGGRLANERFSESPECCAGFLLTRIFGDAEEAGEHADHISVENRRRLIESDAEHGAGRVAANAGQGDKIIVFFRKTSAVPIHDHSRGPLQIIGACVIAESFPELQHFFSSSARQRLHRRQFAHPASPVGNDRLDLRLLEHDFGNPDGVGVSRAAPRQTAGALPEPGEQQSNQRAGLRGAQLPAFALRLTFALHSCADYDNRLG